MTIGLQASPGVFLMILTSYIDHHQMNDFSGTQTHFINQKQRWHYFTYMFYSKSLPEKIHNLS